MIYDEILADLSHRIEMVTINQILTIEDIIYLNESGLTITIEDGYITEYSY